MAEEEVLLPLELGFVPDTTGKDTTHRIHLTGTRLGALMHLDKGT